MGQTSSKRRHLRSTKVSPLSVDLHDPSGKQKRGGKVAQAFRRAMTLLNSYTRKTKVKQFKTPLADQDLESSGHASFSSTGTDQYGEVGSWSSLELWHKMPNFKEEVHVCPNRGRVDTASHDSDATSRQSSGLTDTNPVALVCDQRTSEKPRHFLEEEEPLKEAVGALKEAEEVQKFCKNQISEDQACDLTKGKKVPSLSDSDTEKGPALGLTEMHPLALLYNESDTTSRQASDSTDRPTVDPYYDWRGMERPQPCCEEEERLKQPDREMGIPQASMATNHKVRDILKQTEEVGSGTCLKVWCKQSTSEDHAHVQCQTRVIVDSEAEGQQASGQPETHPLAFVVDVNRTERSPPCWQEQKLRKQVQNRVTNLLTSGAEDSRAASAREQSEEVASGSSLEIQSKNADMKHEVHVQRQTGEKGFPASLDNEAKREETAGPTDTPPAVVGFEERRAERSPPCEKQKPQSQVQQEMGILQTSDAEDPKGAVKRFYDQGELLGEGGYGSTYEGFRKSDGLLVAIKYVSKSKAEMVMDSDGPIPVEVALLKRVNSAPSCPYIIRLIEWFDLPTEYALILERPYPCKDLLDVCISLGGKLSEELARNVMLHVVKALIHCQNRGVMHRDLKPENLLMTTTEIKLIDFGCGAFLKDTPFYQFFGTEFYCPPEVFLQRQYLAGPATVWSFGVTLYHLVSGHLPFKSREEIIKHNLILPSISEVCKLLISWCLQPKPKNRPTLEQIQRHPWFH